jgi:hypothetical protein
MTQFRKLKLYEKDSKVNNFEKIINEGISNTTIYILPIIDIAYVLVRTVILHWGNYGLQ